MLELTKMEHVCPSCQSDCYPEHSAVQEILCGDENVCYPQSKNYEDSDCKVYYFCSDACATDMKSRVSVCQPVPRWKQLMYKISRISKEKGLAGIRAHELHKAEKQG